MWNCMNKQTDYNNVFSWIESESDCSEENERQKNMCNYECVPKRFTGLSDTIQDVKYY
jgi:hypothetical protein